MQRLKQEIIAYRIINRNLKAIFKKVPFNNATAGTYQITVETNIKVDDFYPMYYELYGKIGYSDYYQTSKMLRNEKSEATDIFDELIKVWINENAVLRITSVRATFIEKILSLINNGLLENFSVQEITAKMTKYFNRYKWEALRIARTETTTALNASILLAGQNSNLVSEKVWTSVQDNRTRIFPFDHLDMNGQRQEEDKPFFVGGENIQYPGDVNASAGNVINCRCKITLVPIRDKDGNLVRKNI